LRLHLDAQLASLVFGSGERADGLLFGLEQNGFLFGIGVGARFGGAFFG